MAGVGEGWELPAEAAPWSDFHWFRVGARSALLVVVLSEKPVWYAGHYVDGRMWPCVGPGCKLCAEGVGGQVRYVLAVAEVTTHRAGLLELGRGLGELIRDWIPRRQGLRGMVLEFTKHSHSRISRTEVSYIDRDEMSWWRAIRIPDIRNALICTWRKGNMPIPPGLL